MPLDADYRDKLSLEGGISGAPVFFVSAAHFPSFSGQRGSEGDVGEVLKLAVRLDRRGGRAI